MEKNIWQSVKSLKLRWADRIESGVTASGFPDTHLLVCGESWFIELKDGHINKENCIITKAPVRPSQIRWHMKYHRANHRSGFLIKFDNWNTHTHYLISSRLALLLARHKLNIDYAMPVRNWTEEGLADALDRMKHETLVSSKNYAEMRINR